MTIPPDRLVQIRPPQPLVPHRWTPPARPFSARSVVLVSQALLAVFGLLFLTAAKPNTGNFETTMALACTFLTLAVLHSLAYLYVYLRR